MIAIICEEEGCKEIGTYVYLPEFGLQYDGHRFCYCDYHMKRHGWCPGCLNFWGGIESFDFSSTGFCEECSMDIRDETTLDEDYYENY